MRAIAAGMARKKAKGSAPPESDASDEADNSDEDETGGTPIGGPTRQSPRAKAAKAQAKGSETRKEAGQATGKGSCKDGN